MRWGAEEKLVLAIVLCAALIGSAVMLRDAYSPAQANAMVAQQGIVQQITGNIAEPSVAHQLVAQPIAFALAVLALLVVVSLVFRFSPMPAGQPKFYKRLDELDKKLDSAEAKPQPAGHSAVAHEEKKIEHGLEMLAHGKIPSKPRRHVKPKVARQEKVSEAPEEVKKVEQEQPKPAKISAPKKIVPHQIKPIVLVPAKPHEPKDRKQFYRNMQLLDDELGMLEARLAKKTKKGRAQ